jgi:hypothetical protein
MNTTRTDHTACYSHRTHTATPAGRAWCRKNGVVREWLLVWDNSSAQVIQAVENADLTAHEEGFATDAVRWYRVAYDTLTLIRDHEGDDTQV